MVQGLSNSSHKLSIRRSLLRLRTRKLGVGLIKPTPDITNSLGANTDSSSNFTIG